MRTRPIQTDTDEPCLVGAGAACHVHGVACWFDVAFVGSTVERWLSTAPGYPTTHWYLPDLTLLLIAFMAFCITG